jgi:hypothetical protein
MVAAGKVALDELDVKIWRLRAENGLPWRRIADLVERDHKSVRQRWERMLREAVPIARVQELQAEQNELLDVLLAEVLVIARGQELVARAVPVRDADGLPVVRADGTIATEVVETAAYTHAAKDRVQAIRAAAGLLKRRADLNGLDAPKRVEVEDVTPRTTAVVASDLADLVAGIRRHAGLTVIEGQVVEDEGDDDEEPDEEAGRRGPFLALG